MAGTGKWAESIGIDGGARGASTGGFTPSQIGAAQTRLRALGYRNASNTLLVTTNSMTPGTQHAINNFIRVNGLGPVTFTYRGTAWNRLFSSSAIPSPPPPPPVRAPIQLPDPAPIQEAYDRPRPTPNNNNSGNTNNQDNASGAQNATADRCEPSIWVNIGPHRIRIRRSLFNDLNSLRGNNHPTRTDNRVIGRLARALRDQSVVNQRNRVQIVTYASERFRMTPNVANELSRQLRQLLRPPRNDATLIADHLSDRGYEETYWIPTRYSLPSHDFTARLYERLEIRVPGSLKDYLPSDLKRAYGVVKEVKSIRSFISIMQGVIGGKYGKLVKKGGELVWKHRAEIRYMLTTERVYNVSILHIRDVSIEGEGREWAREYRNVRYRFVVSDRGMRYTTPVNDSWRSTPREMLEDGLARRRQ